MATASSEGRIDHEHAMKRMVIPDLQGNVPEGFLPLPQDFWHCTQWDRVADIMRGKLDHTYSTVKDGCDHNIGTQSK